MPVATTTLPVGWSKILDDVQMRLDQALAAANARIEEMPASEPDSRTPERHVEVTQWNERLRRLSALFESAEQVVQSVDEHLQKEETTLRQHLGACETLRQKLSERTSGAIG